MRNCSQFDIVLVLFLLIRNFLIKFSLLHILQMIVPKRAAILLDRIMVALHHALEDDDKVGIRRISDMYKESKYQKQKPVQQRIKDFPSKLIPVSASLNGTEFFFSNYIIYIYANTINCLIFHLYAGGNNIDNHIPADLAFNLKDLPKTFLTDDMVSKYRIIICKYP